MKRNFINSYIIEIKNCLDQIKDQNNLIIKLNKIYKSIKKNNKIIIYGNGGSASNAIHFCTDITKILNKKSITFDNANLITCYSNDYGFDNFVKQSINSHFIKNDIVILISSSGESQNIIEAAKFCIKKKIKLITLSAFNFNNKLKRLNKNGINFYINTKSYNISEISHLIILLLSIDLFKGKKYYKSNIGKIK
jgi:D-sedoheptulose 7-phosphate isomerase